MENFEEKMRRLAHREPSEALDGRVLDALSRRVPRRERRVVSFRWALAACFLMAMFGFLAGRIVPAGPGRVTAAIPAPAVSVQVIYNGPAANPFDVTTAADDGLRPVSEIKFPSNSGV